MSVEVTSLRELRINNLKYFFYFSDDTEQVEGDGTEEQAAPPPPVVKKSAWARPGAKKVHKGGAGAKNKQRGVKQKQPAAAKLTAEATKSATAPATPPPAAQDKSSLNKDDSDSDAAADSDNENETNDPGSDRSSDDDKKVSSVDDDDEEWEKFQQKLNKREKLEGKSKVSHSVHCPYFPEDKQEYWWTYICDRKSRTLLTAPYHVTNLVDREEVQLKFTAPRWPGIYTFAVCLRSGKIRIELLNVVYSLK